MCFFECTEFFSTEAQNKAWDFTAANKVPKGLKSTQLQVLGHFIYTYQTDNKQLLFVGFALQKRFDSAVLLFKVSLSKGLFCTVIDSFLVVSMQLLQFKMSCLTEL